LKKGDTHVGTAVALTSSHNAESHSGNLEVSIMNRNEQRHCSRLPGSFPVRYRAPRDKERCGFTANVSNGGLFIFTAARHQPGTCIDLEIELPNSGRAHMTGVVVFDEDLNARGGFGVRLINASESWKSHFALLKMKAA